MSLKHFLSLCSAPLSIILFSFSVISQNTNSIIPKNFKENDTIISLTSIDNVLYTGVDNYIIINNKLLPFKNIIVECTMGIVMEENGKYLVVPAKTNNTYIIVYQYDNGDTLEVFRKYMKVQKLPNPYITFDDQKLLNLSVIEKEKLCKAKQFKINISSDIKDNWQEIKSINIKYNYKNRIVEKSFEGYNINDELIKDINKINNDTITFTFLIC